MDIASADVAIFLFATFVAALVAGLAGFAFGLVAAAVWLHILTPLQTASLIIAFGLIVQGVSVWKLRHALQWDRLWPFLVGATLGVPAGVAILGWASPAYMRAAVGMLLILYSAYGLVRPTMQPILADGASADAGVGLLNGILGGSPGLAGIIVTVWCGLRGWPKDVQRAVFQPIGVAIFAMSALWLEVGGAVNAEARGLQRNPASSQVLSRSRLVRGRRALQSELRRFAQCRAPGFDHSEHGSNRRQETCRSSHRFCAQELGAAMTALSVAAPVLMQVDRLAKRYGDQHALTDISFAANAGEVLGLIGPNGAGKTTLLQAIAGIVAADDGQILWRGTPLPLPRRRGFLFYLPDGVRPGEGGVRP